MANTTAAAAQKKVSRSSLIVSSRSAPGQSSLVVEHLLGTCRPSSCSQSILLLGDLDLLEDDRQNDEPADKRSLPERVDTCEKERVAKLLNEEGADHRSVGGAIAARETRSANDGTSDDAQLVPLSESVSDRSEPSDKEDGRNGSHESAKHVHGNFNWPDRDTGQAGGSLVAADRRHVTAPSGHRQEKVQNESACNHRVHDVRNAERLAPAKCKDRLLRLAEGIDHSAARHDQGHAASHAQHAQRDEKRRQTQICDKASVDRAERNAQEESRRKPGP